MSFALNQDLRVETPRGTARVILHAKDQKRVEGKFVAGVGEQSGEWMLVFDDSAVWHRDIAANYGVKPSGGGWMVIDHTAKTVRLEGRSTQFGREPSRARSLELMRAALPDYECAEVG